MNTYKDDFRAFRRGRGVRIRGKVYPSCEGATPRLDRVPEPRTDTRTFRLVWNRERVSTSRSYYPPVVFDHFETDVPEFVKTIRILLTCDQECVIKSCQP